jgi:hypothetical protein
MVGSSHATLIRAATKALLAASACAAERRLGWSRPMRTLCLTAASNAPAFSIKLRSLHVSPLSQKMTGIGEPLPALGSMTENFIVHPSTALVCSYLRGVATARVEYREG